MTNQEISELDKIALASANGCVKSKDLLYRKVKNYLKAMVYNKAHLKSADDLWSCANMAFMETIERFEITSLNSTFIAQLSRNFNNELNKEFQKSTIVHIPVYLYFDSFHIVKWLRNNLTNPYDSLFLTEKDILLAMNELGLPAKNANKFFDTCNSLWNAGSAVEDLDSYHAMLDKSRNPNLDELNILSSSESMSEHVLKAELYSTIEKVISFLPGHMRTDALKIVMRNLDEGGFIESEEYNLTINREMNVKKEIFSFFRDYCKFKGIKFDDFIEE